MISNELLLLKIIDANSRIALLLDRGLSPAQIAMIIQEQKSKGNIIVSNDRLELTDSGKAFLNENLKKMFPRKKERWIIPQEHLYLPPLSRKVIVLPKSGKI